MKLQYALLLVFLLIGCAKYDRTLKLSNLNREQTITLKKNESQKNIVGLHIKINGFIVGNATISLMEDDKSYRSIGINGNFNFLWNSEWYSDSAKIRYHPIDANSGEINIQYSFCEL